MTGTLILDQEPGVLPGWLVTIPVLALAGLFLWLILGEVTKDDGWDPAGPKQRRYETMLAVVNDPVVANQHVNQCDGCPDCDPVADPRKEPRDGQA